MGALVKETYQMLTTVTRLLRRFGIMIRVSSGPLTEDEWERQRVLPIYQDSLAEDDEADLLDPEQIQAFRRGEIPFSAVTVKD
jgi:hypothetical protein